MPTFLKKACYAVRTVFWLLITYPAFADLPKPPDKDIANGSHDWSDVRRSDCF